MDRSRTVLLVAAVASLAAALFAIGAGVTSTEDTQTAPDTAVSIPEATTTAASTGTVEGTVTADGATTAPTEEVARFDIEIAGFEFGPAETVVQVGTEVVWTNNDGFDHTIVAANDAFPASTTLGQGDTYSFTFTEPGTYTYICGIHPQMSGTIVVEG